MEMKMEIRIELMIINITIGVWQGVVTGHGLSKVSPRPAMTYPSTSCGPGVAHLQGGQPAAVLYPFGHPMPYAYVNMTKMDEDEDRDQV
jgi:hypothetical protein